MTFTLARFFASALLSLVLTGAVAPLLEGCQRCASSPRPTVQTAYATCELAAEQPWPQSACDPGLARFVCANYMVNFYAATPPGIPPQCFDLLVPRAEAQEFAAAHGPRFPPEDPPHVYCEGR